MHAEALDFIGKQAAGSQWALNVLDVGGRNVNGSPRHLWPAADWTVLDAMPGEGVDLVVDAASWATDRLYDVVVCAEVLEHTADWPEVLTTCVKALRPGGLLVVTCATHGRAPHSAVDGGPLHPGEHYGNVPARAAKHLLDCLDATPVRSEHHESRGDLYLAAAR